MQPTTCLHDGGANAILHEAYLILDHPIALHTANGVFNTNADRRDRTIGRLLRWGEFTPRRVFLQLDDGDTVEYIALEAHLLVEATAVWPGIALQLSQACSIRLSCIPGTHAAHVTGFIAHEEVLDRVARLLAAVIVLLVVGIAGAVDRSLRAIMPNRGDAGTSSVR